MMQNDEVIKKIKKVCQLDIDAVHAYSQAIQNIELEDIKTQLTVFRQDHQRHVTELSRVIRNLGGEAPDFSMDFKGYMIQGMTLIRSRLGLHAALNAMKQNEELTNRTYEEASSWDLPTEAGDVIRNGLNDEKRHLDYIEQLLQSKPWERQKAA